MRSKAESIKYKLTMSVEYSKEYDQYNSAYTKIETLRHSNAKVTNTIFQNKSPLLFISLPINALDNVVTVI